MVNKFDVTRNKIILFNLTTNKKKSTHMGPELGADGDVRIQTLGYLEVLDDLQVAALDEEGPRHVSHVPQTPVQGHRQ